MRVLAFQGIYLDFEIFFIVWKFKIINNFITDKIYEKEKKKRIKQMIYPNNYQ